MVVCCNQGERQRHTVLPLKMPVPQACIIGVYSSMSGIDEHSAQYESGGNILKDIPWQWYEGCDLKNAPETEDSGSQKFEDELEENRERDIQDRITRYFKKLLAFELCKRQMLAAPILDSFAYSWRCRVEYGEANRRQNKAE